MSGADKYLLSISVHGYGYSISENDVGCGYDVIRIRIYPLTELVKVIVY